MIGLVVIFGVLTTCSANSYIEREFLQIRATLNRQEREIKELRGENRVLRADMDKLNAEIQRLTNGQDTSPRHYDEIRENNNSEEEIIQSKQLNTITESDVKRIRHTRISPEPVAFYAYMSNNEPSPSVHHSLIFDVAKTNLGGGYNEYSGMFTAPSSGAYVFTWTIYTGNHGATKFAIYVNHDVVDSTFGETDDDLGDYDSDSGSIVVSLNVRDNVYIRSAITCTTQVISNSVYARTSFAGWKLN
ncbi:uncharacterized protein LOC125651758 [Ostrea edulis]|uniref:uncharacterized protein LOC125651758 n=1 Tax=Ostrea edulis TaxID=37623 RepID=UPI0024AEB011|nr:uncharacterized protein LOC125651758 [Ostrea edulis]